jgi:hypothetical protein
MSKTLDEATQRKLARNQVLFREVNEQIRSLSSSVAEDGKLAVVCECSHDNCMVLLPVSVEQYELVRRVPTRFFVSEGHNIPALERVVEQTADYVVVEKFGAAAPVAIRMDPRGHHSDIFEEVV